MRSHRIAYALILVAASLGPITVEWAQSGRSGEQGHKPYKLPPNLQEYLRNKYAHVEESLVSTIQETPDGPLGSLNFRGHIVPKSPIGGLTPEDRARTAAKAFIADESDLLDIADPAELEEVSSRVDENGVTTVHYIRTINGLPLSGTVIRVDVGPDDAITRFYAMLSPAPPALYEAATRTTLAKEEVVRIVERDLKHGKKTPVRISNLSTAATWRSPYVVWGATASVESKPAWAYTVDAFTGKILAKGCTAVPIRADSNATPCD